MAALQEYLHISRSWLRQKQYLLLGLGLIGLHLGLTERLTGRSDQLILNGLFWGAIALRLSQRWSQLPVLGRAGESRGTNPCVACPVTPSVRWGQRLGLALMGGMGVLALGLSRAQASWVRPLPAVMAIAWVLWVSGGRWRAYRAEALLVLALIVPQGWLSERLQPWVGPTLECWVAQTAHFGLHYLGIVSERFDNQLRLVQGAVEVQYGCVGVPLVILLLQLALLFGVLNRAGWRQGLGLGLGAIAIAWVLSSARVALMATVVQSPEEFGFWHGPEGNQWFSNGAILIFSGLGYRPK